MSYRYSKFLPGFTFVCDVLLFNLATYDPLYVSTNTNGNNISVLFYLFLANLIWIILSPLSDTYKISRPLLLKDNLSKFLQTLLYHVLIIFGTVYLFKVNNVNPLHISVSYLLFILFVIFQRYLLCVFLDYIRARGYNCRTILLLGDKDITDALVKHFYIHPEYGYDLINTKLDSEIRQLTEDDLTVKILQENPDEIFICYRQIDEMLLDFLIKFGYRYNIKIKFVPDMILTNSYAKLINFDHLPILQTDQQINRHALSLLGKRAFDVLFSLTALIVGSPILIVLYIITRLSSSGPAYYRQERVGLNGRAFKIVKFRSMYVDAEKAGPQTAKHNDPRVTNWGRIIRKTRLDELPQFWNVLVGDMSVVGPRPERQHFIEKISEVKPNYKKLLTIKPGITSVGQINYGYAENVDEMCKRMEYDLLYLQNMNLNSDMKLIMQTVRVMVQGKGK